MTHQQNHGFLLAITKNGLTSHLYGTMHVGKEGWELNDKVQAAMSGSEALAVEVDYITNEENRNELIAAMEAHIARNRYNMLRADTRTPERDAFMDAVWDKVGGRPEDMFRSCPYSGEAMTFSNFLSKKLGYCGSYGSEKQLTVLAIEKGIAVTSMERVQTHLDLMTSVPTVDQEAAMVDEMIAMGADAFYEASIRVLTAFERGDYALLADVVEHMNSSANRQVTQALLAKRNHTMANYIDEMHMFNTKLFAAVGCAHLLGETGIVNLLIAKGYTVEAL